MLDGRPVVFLSCSDKYKESVAAKLRDALAEVGVWGVIVSDEPLRHGSGGSRAPRLRPT